MKAYFSLIGALCPKIKQSTHTSIGIYKSAITIFLISFCFVFAAKAQESEVNSPPVAKAEESSQIKTSTDEENKQTEIAPLKIGDKIPDELWDLSLQIVNHPDGKETITLKDYQDKLIILDFWATWCGPCITSLQRLDTLQKQFQNDLMVIPRSYEPEDKVTAFFIKKGISLPSLVSEKSLKSYFPHKTIPHQIWIKNGEIIAIPHHEYANPQNINKIINGEKVEILDKTAVDYDSSNPLLIDGNGGTGDQLLYQSIITKRINTNSAGSAPASSRGFLFYNGTAFALLTEAFYNRVKSNKQVVYEVSDSLFNLLDFGEKRRTGNFKEDAELESWLEDYIFSYNLTTSIEMEEDLIFKIIQNDLNNYFRASLGVYGVVERRKLDCWVLEQKGSINKLKTEGYKRHYKKGDNQFVLVNQSMKFLTLVLDSYFPHKILIDKSGINDHVDIIVPSGLKTQNDMNSFLSEYGLKIVNKKLPVDMLVIKEVEKGGLE